jgi:hypothetical protein
LGVFWEAMEELMWVKSIFAGDASLGVDVSK